MSEELKRKHRESFREALRGKIGREPTEVEDVFGFAHFAFDMYLESKKKPE